MIYLENLKELLDELKGYVRYNQEYPNSNANIELTPKEIKLLLDYITNLQKRNKEIYDGFIATTEELCETTEKLEKVKQENKRISSKVEKALHFLKYATYTGNFRLYHDKLVDILKGSDDNE